MKAKARVTVRSNLDRFVGGATEETIIARVGEGIVSAIGSADSYKTCWKIPTAFPRPCSPRASIAAPPSRFSPSTSPTWTSAKTSAPNCRAEQADADKRVAQAKAEVRRAAAVAVEQEMRARAQEMRAKVVEAEAQVPLAMAEAFRSGNLGIMDYMRMKNIQADTSMRESIAGADKPRSEGT